MRTFTRGVTASVLAATLMAGGTRPAAAQVVGGDEECSYELVIDGFLVSGTTIIPRWHVEVTCVRVLDDDVEPATSAQ